MTISTEAMALLNWLADEQGTLPDTDDLTRKYATEILTALRAQAAKIDGLNKSIVAWMNTVEDAHRKEKEQAAEIARLTAAMAAQHSSAHARYKLLQGDRDTLAAKVREYESRENKAGSFDVDAALQDAEANCPCVLHQAIRNGATTIMVAEPYGII